MGNHIVEDKVVYAMIWVSFLSALAVAVSFTFFTETVLNILAKQDDVILSEYGMLMTQVTLGYIVFGWASLKMVTLMSMSKDSIKGYLGFGFPMLFLSLLGFNQGSIGASGTLLWYLMSLSSLVFIVMYTIILYRVFIRS